MELRIVKIRKAKDHPYYIQIKRKFLFFSWWEYLRDEPILPLFCFSLPPKLSFDSEDSAKRYVMGVFIDELNEKTKPEITIVKEYKI